MWIFCTNAFLSVVAHKDKPDSLLVRSRLRSDISSVFPEAIVLASTDSDYKYRATIDRVVVAAAIQASILNIDYPNFKDTLDHSGHARSDAYFDVWDRMRELQDTER